MERPFINEISSVRTEQYRESLERARKEFPGLIRRLSNKISPEDRALLIDPDLPEFNPQLEYPDLFDLTDDRLEEKRRTIEDSLYFIKKLESNGYIPTIEDEFDKQKAIDGLANTHLLILAHKMQSCNDFSLEENIRMFIEINERMNGAVDERLYQGIVNSMHETVDKVAPQQPTLYKIAQELKSKIPQSAGAETKIGLPKNTFDTYANTYHLLFDSWLNEIITENKNSFDAEGISEVFKNAMSSMGFVVNVEISEDVTSLKYRKEENKLFVPATRQMSRQQLAAKVVHETGHLTRAWNGSHLSRQAENGLPDYLNAEDGLMSYGEEFLTGRQQSNPTYIERYLGVGLLSGTVDGVRKDFKDTFSAMWRARVLLESLDKIEVGEDVERSGIVLARKESLMNAQRLFRGGDGKTAGLGWTKDKVYYEGVAKLTDFLVGFERKFGLEYLPVIFAGKFDPTNPLHNKYMGMPL